MQTAIKDKRSFLAFVNSLIGQKESTDDESILQFIKQIIRTGKKAKSMADHIVYSSFKRNKELHDKTVGDILSLIKNSVLVEESKAKSDKKNYDKADRFYIPVRTQEGMFTVRLVALYNKNNQSFNIESDVYDVIAEEGPILSR